MNLTRYIISHSAADAAAPARLITHAAELAATQEQAASQFAAKHPGRVIERITPVQDKREAFLRYGEGAWTDEEIAAHRARQQEQAERSRREHERTRQIVSACSLAEIALEQEYAARRAAETTPNADGVHVGDIFCGCWGYDQTNWDFYQVVALRGKHTAVLRQNACKAELCGDDSGYKRPIRDSFLREAEYTVRTRWDEYYKAPSMRIPDLSGNHSMRLAEFGRLYEYSTYD